MFLFMVPPQVHDRIFLISGLLGVYRVKSALFMIFPKTLLYYRMAAYEIVEPNCILHHMPLKYYNKNDTLRPLRQLIALIKSDFPGLVALDSTL